MTTGKDKPLPFKPIVTGKPVSRLSARRGFKLMAYQAIFVPLYVFMGQLMVVDSAWLRILFNLVVLAAFFALMFSDGVKAGTDDAGFSEIAYLHQSQGKDPTEQDLARCFHPLKGLFTALVGALPWVILCLMLAVTATKAVYRLGPLPGWMTPYLSAPDVGPALSYYSQGPGMSFSEMLRIPVRLLIFPYVNLVGADNAQALLWLERFSPLVVMLIPMGYALGYPQGRRMRAKVHQDIKTNEARRVRKEKKQRKQRDQAPKQLV